MEARETERHYEIESRRQDSKGIWITFKINAILHFTRDGRTELTVQPCRNGDKFWFNKSDPKIVHIIASMIASVAKDCMDKENPNEKLEDVPLPPNGNNGFRMQPYEG